MELSVSTDAIAAVPTDGTPVQDNVVNFDPFKKKRWSYEYNGETIWVDPQKVYREFVQAIDESGDLDDTGGDAELTGMEVLFENAYKELDGLKRPDGTPYTQKDIDFEWKKTITPARLTIVNAIRKAFGYTELKRDGSGMSEQEAMELFESFWSMQDDVKKNTVPTPS